MIGFQDESRADRKQGKGNKVFIILEADSSSIHLDASCQQRVDLKKPSKRILVIIRILARRSVPVLGLAESSPKPSPHQTKLSRPRCLVFLPTPPSMHVHSSPKMSSGVHRIRKPGEAGHIHVNIRQVESKKANSRPFPTHFMHANPSRSEKAARIQISNNCTRSSKEKRSVCRQMKKKTA